MDNILEVEYQEEIADKKFLLTIGLFLLMVGLFIFVNSVIMPTIEQINPVGNLIILR